MTKVGRRGPLCNCVCTVRFANDTLLPNFNIAHSVKYSIQFVYVNNCNKILEFKTRLAIQLDD